MKKWILRIGSVFCLILLGVAAVIIWNEFDYSVIKKRVKNENLSTVKSDWQGTPVDQSGRFVNQKFPFLPSTIDLLKWQLSANPQKQEKERDNSPLEIKDAAEFLNSTEDGLIWFGHATFLIRIGGVTILTDPVFGDPSFIKKFIDVPNPLPQIKKLDYVLISHDHRDHCDETTIHRVSEKFPEAKFLTGLKMEELVGDWKSESNEIQTAGWFQQFSLLNENIKIYFTPVRHWSRRGLFDANERLWGGFLIESKAATIYFGGDSGYSIHYKQLAEVFPEIDYFLIGIGAYEPRWFMKANHNNPEDALQAFQDSKAKYLVPMHYGTFDLSDEPPSEPIRRLKEKASEMNLSSKIKMLNINENLIF